MPTGKTGRFHEVAAPATPLLLLVTILVGLNLRPFLTATGPLASEIHAATGLGDQAIALLTLLPMLLMGIAAFAGPALQAVVGSRAAIAGGLALLGVASMLRLAPSGAAMLIGTAALCGLGVAIVQAVFPGIVKAHFPDRIAIVMGLYSAMLMGGGALGARLSPMVADLTANWRAGLVWVAPPALLAALLAAIALPRSGSRQAASMPLRAMLGRPRTWLLMICFGLVNGGYSSIVAWLAPAYQTIGWTRVDSGGLLALMALAQATAALALPAFAARRRDCRPWIWLTLLLQASGFAGLALWPQAFPVGWALLVGAGLGGCFALSMVVALDHLEDSAQAGALSALMQGGGFLLAAIPPWILALLHGLTGTFASGWLMHLSCVALVALLTLRLTPDGYASAMSGDGSEILPIAEGERDHP